MKRRTLLHITAAAVAYILFFPFLTIMFIPAGEIEGVVVRGLKREGYDFRTDGFRKSFPLGLEARGVTVSDRRGPLLKFDEVDVRLKLLPLFVGKVVVGFHGVVGDGEVQADFEPRTEAVAFRAEKVRLEDVPILMTATGANFKGEMFLEGSFRGKGDERRGQVKLDVKQAELSAVKIGEFPLPDAAYRNIRGMFRAEGGKGTLESLAFQGDGIYMRLKGDIQVSGPAGQAPLDLILELMPKPDIFEKQKLVFLLLARYQTTPGVYRIPVGGTLLKPSIQ